MVESSISGFVNTRESGEKLVLLIDAYPGNREREPGS